MDKIRNIKLLQLFLRFLKEEDYHAYEKYKSLTNERLVNVINSTDAVSYISASKPVKGWKWSETKEGTKYWYVIHFKWIIFLFYIIDEPYMASIICKKVTNNNISDFKKSISSNLRANSRVIYDNKIHHFDDELIKNLLKVMSYGLHC